MPHRITILCTLLFAVLIVGCAGSSIRPHQPRSELANLHQLNDWLYSGGQPDGRQAYEQLRSLGIKTVISVDALAPDKALADEFGIRIVHLPIGYDGISDQRSIQLARAIASLPRPIYIHCHHGKHRGPAALCVGAIGAGEMTHLQAETFMTSIGTAHDYPGLWNSVANAHKLSRSYLDNDQIPLPEQADIGDYAHTMAEIDRLNELLWLCADNNFIAPDDHPDLAPKSLAGQIHNLLRSLEDDQLVEDEGIIFEELLNDTVALAEQVESQIGSQQIENAINSMDALTESCVRCHERFRD